MRGSRNPTDPMDFSKKCRPNTFFSLFFKSEKKKISKTNVLLSFATLTSVATTIWRLFAQGRHSARSLHQKLKHKWRHEHLHFWMEQIIISEVRAREYYIFLQRNKHPASPSLYWYADQLRLSPHPIWDHEGCTSNNSMQFVNCLLFKNIYIIFQNITWVRSITYILLSISDTEPRDHGFWKLSFFSCLVCLSAIRAKNMDLGVGFWWKSNFTAVCLVCNSKSYNVFLN